MQIEPIGFLKSCYDEKFGTPRQPGLSPASWGILEFSEDYRTIESVRALEGFSHIWLIFGFHLTRGHGWRPTVRPPRLGGNQRVGVFASRSTFRPNGLGLSLVQIVRIEREKREGLKPPALFVSGVDLVNDTPVYDIKPYLPYAESIPNATVGYAAEEIRRYQVEVDASALETFQSLQGKTQQVILEALSLDPRPATTSLDLEKIYGVQICGLNVQFRFRGVTCWIVGIQGELKE